MEKKLKLIIPWSNSPGMKKMLLYMKLTLVISLVAALQTWAAVSYSQTTTLSIKLKNATVQAVLQQVEDQSEFYFLYSRSLIDIDRNVDVQLKDAKIAEVLDVLFAGTDVSYKVDGRQIVLSKKSESSTFDVQQQKSIFGKVTDSSGEPLPGVSVVVKGTTTGTITDTDGKYTLANVSSNATLLFSFVGMKSQELAVGNQTTMNVVLIDETIGLEEVVAVGYGVQKKSLVTGAISSVDKADLQNTSVTRGEQILQGKTAGVQVVSQSGSPGAGVKIRIRGYASNGSSEPLYIVNGMKTTDINNIDPNDIQSMEVLKDAASSAIYGAEGANGVIIIKTKSGEGIAKISYNYSSTWQNVSNLPKMLNAEQYSTYMKEGGYSPVGTASTDTDWLGQIFETSLMQKHHVSFTKGNESSNFMLSMSYLNNDGIVKGDKDRFQRYTLMFNSESKMNKWLKVGHSISYSYTKRNPLLEDSEYDSVIGNSLLLDPLTPVIYDDSSIPSTVQNLITAGKVLLKNPEGKYYGISQNITSAINPLGMIGNTHVDITRHTLIGNIFAEISPFEGFKFTTRMGLNGDFGGTHTWAPVYYYSVNRYNDLSSVTEDNSSLTNILWENYGSYTKKIGEHDFTVLLGMSYDDKQIKTTYAFGGPLVKDQQSYSELDFISKQSNDYVKGNSIIARKLSYYSRLSYNYKGRYMLEGSLRRDAASTYYLPVNNRWGTFPSVSLGWNVSNEKFFRVAQISSLKLRASWGQNGSLSNIGNYMYSSNLGATSTLISEFVKPVVAGLTFIGSDGTSYSVALPTQLPNNKLRWETSEQTDIGFDGTFFRGKLSLSADYYWKLTKDLLTASTPPLEAGNVGAIVNSGNVINRGFELNLNYKGTMGKVKYGVGGNLSTLHNEVTYLPKEISRINGALVNNTWVATAFEKGYPVWYFRGYKFTGVDKTTGQPTFQDINNDKVINADDQTYIGSGIPKLIYGINLSLQYKNFDFKAFAQGQAGNDLLIGFVRNDQGLSNKLAMYYDNRWTATNTNGTIPKAGADQKYWFSDAMMQNGSYMKIKQIQFGYNIPDSFVKKAHLGFARVYISLDDFFLFTKYKGMDPEAGSSTNSSLGIDRGVYPTSQKVMVGLSVSF